MREFLPQLLLKLSVFRLCDWLLLFGVLPRLMPQLPWPSFLLRNCPRYFRFWDFEHSDFLPLGRSPKRYCFRGPLRSYITSSTSSLTVKMGSVEMSLRCRRTSLVIDRGDRTFLGFLALDFQIGLNSNHQTDRGPNQLVWVSALPSGQQKWLTIRQKVSRSYLPEASSV